MAKNTTKEKVVVKTRNYQFVSYVPPSQYVDLLRGARHYCWIKHDNPEDLKRDDGTEKEVHYHCVVVFENSRYESALFKRVRTWSDEHGTNIRVESCADLRSSLLYLTHENEKSLFDERVTYKRDALNCDDFTWYNTIIDNGEVGSFSIRHFLRDLLTQSPFENALLYGRDYMKNYIKYCDFIKSCLAEVKGDASALLAILDGTTVQLGNQLEACSAIDKINGGDK